MRHPTRRNRKIGTTSQGYKPRNDFAIPSSRHDHRRFYEKLKDPVELSLNLSTHQFAVLVEPVFPGFKYYVSVQDVLEVLKLIPQQDREDIKVIVFRQPKRKERIFSPVWGRMAYWAEFGEHAGTSIVIEAIPVGYSYHLSNHVGPVFARELEALIKDGHHLRTTQRRIDIDCPPDAIRRTQLFRTLPHEIGHNVDYLTKVERPGKLEEGDQLALRDLYFARPQCEREAFADRYAHEIMERFRDNDIVPFPPLPNQLGSGLDPEWFYFDGSSAG